MLIDLNDSQLILILKTPAQKHAVLYIQNKNYHDIERLIEFIINSLEMQGKKYLIGKVYKEVDDNAK